VEKDIQVQSDPDHTFYIQQNSVKWTLLISGWTFRSMNNRLKLTVRLSVAILFMQTVCF